MKHFNVIQKKAFIIFMLFVFITNVFALDYTITFTGSGASVAVENILVQNITKGTSVTVAAGQVLYLKDMIAGVGDLTVNPKTISIYPNPVRDVSTLSFYAPNAGNVHINIADIAGREVFHSIQEIQTGTSSFQLALPYGIFLVNIAGNDFRYSEKIVSSSKNTFKPSISVVAVPYNTPKPIQKNKSLAGVAMLFNNGDLLVYSAYSGNNCTVVTDSPTGDKTTNFDFAECKDASGNYYPVVKIGDQLWMASNLKTTKYLNNENIPNVTDTNDWKYLYSPGWCEQNNDANNGNIYGKLYNYYAIADSRKIAPAGWHVATKDEWTVLINHVSTHWSFIESEAKALASKDYWRTSSFENTPGYNPLLNNFSGFSALPGGDRGGFFNGTFFNLGEVAFWWTSTSNSIQDAWYMYFSFDVQYTILDYNKKQYGLSVRCVKD